ncbi:MAG: trypsin-like peptidase domain-containing protein [Oscillospiraceae bacterium]|jgi:serine protease Do|nr:trypsin-like peptidase domain-containing protein [Oscillospiraceae bacterium]
MNDNIYGGGENLPQADAINPQPIGAPPSIPMPQPQPREATPSIPMQQPQEALPATPMPQAYPMVYRDVPATPQTALFVPQYGQYTRQAAPQTHPADNRPAKRKKSPRAAFAATVLVAAVMLSAVFGFGGAYVGNRYFAPESVTGSYDGAVFYQSVPQGDAKTTKTSSGSTGLDVAAVAAKVLDSVVAISTEALAGNGRFTQMVTTGAGSGVILSADGYIVTNNHVIAGAQKIAVRLQNNKEYSAELIGTDEKSDLAVLKINASELTAAIIGNSADLAVGEPAVAIGNPLGELGGTVTEGIISALDRGVTIDGETMTLLQTSAAINPGNSGGGLFNAQGELIGVVNAKSSGTGIEGLGFAIPIDAAKPVITDLTEHGYVTGRVADPFTLVEVGDYRAAMQYRVSELGVYISQSTDSQFLRGDRISAVDGKEIALAADFSAALAGKKPGDKLKITVSRDSKDLSFTLTLNEATS